MRMLITGGAGFIGSNLAKLALERKVGVSIIDDLSTGHLDNIAQLEVKFIKGSILDSVALRESMVGADAVVHLAALGSVPRSISDPIASHAANATGTLTVLEEARKSRISQLVVASSSSVYGMNTALPKTERQWVRPLSPYAVTKLATEQYALAYQQSYGMNTIAFRLFNVYGPGQRAGNPYAAVIPTFIDAMLQDRFLEVNGDGRQSRDFTYVRTVCEILLDAALHRVTHPEPVNLAFGTKTTIAQLVELIGGLAQRTPKIRFCPPRLGDVMHSTADNANLRSLFPTISPVALTVGVAETLAWFERSQ